MKYVGIVYMLSHCGSCLRQRKVDGDQSSVEIQEGYFMDEEVKCTWSFPPYGLQVSFRVYIVRSSRWGVDISRSVLFNTVITCYGIKI